MIESLHGRARKGHAQAQGGALIRECKATKIEGFNQPSSGRALISCVLKLRQTQTRWRCAIAVGIAANHPPEPAQAFFLSPRRERHLRELLSGIIRKLAAWVEIEEAFKRLRRTARICRKAPHRRIVGRTFFGRNPRSAHARQRSTAGPGQRHHETKSPRYAVHTNRREPFPRRIPVRPLIQAHRLCPLRAKRIRRSGDPLGGFYSEPASSGTSAIFPRDISNTRSVLESPRFPR